MEDGLELHYYFSMLRRWLWLVLLCALLGALGAFLISSRTTPVYSASVILLIDQAPAVGPSDYNAILASERLASTYSEMLEKRPVLEETIAMLDLEQTPEELAKTVTVNPVRDTQLIEVSVEGTDPNQTADVANAIAETFMQQNQDRQAARYADSLASMEAQIAALAALIEQTHTQSDALAAAGAEQDPAELARLQSVLAGYRNTNAALQQTYEQMRLTAAQLTDNVTVVESALVPPRPVRPRTLMNAVLAGFVGALLALGVAFLVEYLDDTIKTPWDVRRALGLDTLGSIGQLPRGEGELIVAAEPRSPVAEAFRVLSANVRFSTQDGGCVGSLLVTSPGLAEGKTVTVANLGVAMAQTGLNVVAVDADLRHPQLHRVFGLHPGRKGVSRIALNGHTSGKLQLAHVQGLQDLPGGAPPPNLAEMLESHKLQALLRELVQRTDAVLIDSPPVLATADAAVLARRVDGVLLVLKAGHTRREDARRALESLRHVGANVVGVALYAVPEHMGNYPYDSYEGPDGNGDSARKRRWYQLFGTVR